VLDRLLVVEVLGSDGRVEARQAGVVGHHVADEHAFLVVGGELGPRWPPAR